MELWVKVRVKSHEEIRDCFEFDEIIDIRWYEHIGNNIYNVLIRFCDCDVSFRGVTTLERIKQKVVKASDYYTIKSKVAFSDGSERIIYACNDYWEKQNANKYAEYYNTTVAKIERLEGNGCL